MDQLAHHHGDVRKPELVLSSSFMLFCYKPSALSFLNILILLSSLVPVQTSLPLLFSGLDVSVSSQQLGCQLVFRVGFPTAVKPA